MFVLESAHEKILGLSFAACSIVVKFGLQLKYTKNF